MKAARVGELPCRILSPSSSSGSLRPFCELPLDLFPPAACRPAGQPRRQCWVVAVFFFCVPPSACSFCTASAASCFLVAPRTLSYRRFPRRPSPLHPMLLLRGLALRRLRVNFNTFNRPQLRIAPNHTETQRQFDGTAEPSSAEGRARGFAARSRSGDLQVEQHCSIAHGSAAVGQSAVGCGRAGTQHAGPGVFRGARSAR